MDTQPEQPQPPNRAADGDAGPVKIPYGDRKSRFARAFRAKQPPGAGANLVTFKLVPAGEGERPKWNMRAKYVTLPDSGGEHAEQLIVRLIEGGAYKGIGPGLYRVKWVYSERSPCFGRLGNACADSLRRLVRAQAATSGAPPVQIFYSFDAHEEADAEIERELSRSRQSGDARTLVSTDKGRDPREVERRQEFYEGQLDEDIEYFLKASGVRT